MAKLTDPQWGVVQHSAYGYKRDLDFKKGLGSRRLTKETEVNRVRKDGGKLVGDYMEAEDYCMKEMYPDEAKGLIPRAHGTFHRAKIDGLPIYIPSAGAAE